MRTSCCEHMRRENIVLWIVCIIFLVLFAVTAVYALDTREDLLSARRLNSIAMERAGRLQLQLDRLQTRTIPYGRPSRAGR